MKSHDFILPAMSFTRYGFDYHRRFQVPEHEILKIVRMYEPIITEFFDNQEEMAKFQKWREEQEERGYWKRREKQRRKRERLM